MAKVRMTKRPIPHAARYHRFDLKLIHRIPSPGMAKRRKGETGLGYKPPALAVGPDASTNRRSPGSPYTASDEDSLYPPSPQTQPSRQATNQRSETGD